MNQLRESFGRALDGLTLTVRDVAEILGLSERSIYAYRSGERRLPPTVARQFAAYLRVRSDSLHKHAVRLEEAAERAEGERNE